LVDLIGLVGCFVS